jgi:hypothetical protein
LVISQVEKLDKRKERRVMTEQNQATDITAAGTQGHMHRGADDTGRQVYHGPDDDDTQGHVCPRVVDADDDDVQGHHHRS